MMTDLKNENYRICQRKTVEKNTTLISEVEKIQAYSTEFPGMPIIMCTW
jgi:hypothetical protein